MSEPDDMNDITDVDVLCEDVCMVECIGACGNFAIDHVECECVCHGNGGGSRVLCACCTGGAQ